MSDKSVSRWIKELKAGDAYAAWRLWEEYAERLISAARQQLGHSPRRVADEEDIALSVFHTICRGAANGHFSGLERRDELWWLLVRLTRRKIVNQRRHDRAQKRGEKRVVLATDLTRVEKMGESPLEDLLSEEPTPEFLAILAEEYERLMGGLRDDQLRAIALHRMEGFTPKEIAEQMRISTRSVQRKLRMIEQLWRKEAGL